MNKIYAVVGMCGSGKSIACKYLEEHGFLKVYFGGATIDYVKKQGLQVNEENEKAARETLRKEYGMGAYALFCLPMIEEYFNKGNVVIDGLYSWDEYLVLQEKFGDAVEIVCILTNKKLRYQRLATREIRPLTKEEAISRDIAEIENLKKGGPIAFADYYIYNNDTLRNYYEQLDKIIEKR